MTPTWTLGIDALLALLLIGTIVMAVRLDGALRVIRRDRGVFEALIVNLSSATESVKLGIQALREEADRAARHIGQRSHEADKMATGAFPLSTTPGPCPGAREQIRPHCSKAARRWSHPETSSR